MRMPLRVRALAWAVDHSLLVDIATMGPDQLRRARRPVPDHGPATLLVGAPVPGVGYTDETVTGDGGARLGVRLYRPSRPVPGGGLRPLVVHYHGGGWVLGNARSAAWLCTGIAAATGAVVASVEYRLAPEHRFPTAALDCFSALGGLVAQAGRLGVDVRRVAVAGDSAGGNLSAVVSMLARDAGGPHLAAQALIYPGTDATLSSPSLVRLARAPVLSLPDIRAFLAHYLGPDADPVDPRISVLLAASHAGLPPTLVQTAEYDPLQDDGRRYADALTAAGVPVRYTRYEGMPHGFMSFAGAAGASAYQARSEIVQFLRESFAGAAPEGPKGRPD